MNHIAKKILLFGGLAFAAAGAATAADTVTLKFGTHLGTKAPGVVEAADVFMKTAKELSNNTINFEFYPSEQAGKALQMLDLVRAGAVDIGDVATPYRSEALPLIGILEVPGVAKNVCGVYKAIYKMGTPGGIIYESDFKPNGVRVLSFNPYPPYGPAASRKPITSVEDLRGMKIRSAGGFMELMLQKVSAAPVKMPSVEVYQSLQRGTIDAVLFSFLSVKEYDLQTVAKYGATGYSWGTPGDLFVISERRFQSLSKEQQNALIVAGRKTGEHWCSYIDTAEAKYIAEARAAGMDIYTWSAADVAKLKALAASVPADWAKSLDARGKPGTKVLKEFEAEVSK